MAIKQLNYSTVAWQLHNSVLRFVKKYGNKVIGKFVVSVIRLYLTLVPVRAHARERMRVHIRTVCTRVRWLACLGHVLTTVERCCEDL